MTYLAHAQESPQSLTCMLANLTQDAGADELPDGPANAQSGVLIDPDDEVVTLVDDNEVHTLPSADEQAALLSSDASFGSQLGNLRLGPKLAEGGMGSVHVAVDTTTGRACVVKMLLVEYLRTPSVIKRFFNEVKAAQAIAHPGVVRIYGAGKDGRGRPYMVMEYLQGETLEDRLRRERSLPIELARDITRQIAGVLASAHAAGIVHRDLKPANIFLLSDPGDPGRVRVKLLDFGIAKLMDQGDSPLTCVGDILGTPSYMAPEQCRGMTTIDHRADLYSLGCLLYAMLCGRVPFVGASTAHVLIAHVREPVPSPRALLPTIPVALEALVLALLEKEPDRRPQCAEAVLEALAHEPVALAGEDMAGEDVPGEDVPGEDMADEDMNMASEPMWRRVLVIGLSGILTMLGGGILMTAL